ncbi:MAG: fructosamine kinase family protein [Pseudomonadales bacterium]|nr:fructosamine kinase family protein [Pseudomonadales bacterium]
MPITESHLQQLINEELAEQLGTNYARAKWQRSGVGCINETWQISGEGLQSLFVKVGAPDAEDMYLREQEGLELLSKAERFRVPTVITRIKNEHSACLVMEFLVLTSLREPRAETAFGEALAELHDITATQFGLEQDNYIGRSRQVNGFMDDWWPFFCEKRLRSQWSMAADNNMREALLQRIDAVIAAIPEYFSDHTPTASLVHGDLWSGNVAVDSDGTPAIYDPAVYFGDSETDIAMSKMFQPLGARVYDAYFSCRPATPGTEVRQHVYDLYHWLNHFNLFGVNYLGQVEFAVDELFHKIT